MRSPATTSMAVEPGRQRVRMTCTAPVNLSPAGTRDAKVGEVVTVSIDEAVRLIAKGYAELVGAGVVTKEATGIQIVHLPGSLVTKAAGRRMVSCVASTAAIDRMGDVIEPSGWQLDAYRSNPVVLAGHDHGQPIARAERVAVERSALVADIAFPSAGLSPDADRTWSLIEAGVLRGVSVGFRPLKAEPLPSGGLRFVRQELLEISVVAVPANAEALIQAGMVQARSAAHDGLDVESRQTKGATPRLDRARLELQVAVGREGRASQRAAAIAEEAATAGHHRLAKRAGEARRPLLTARTAELARLRR